MKTKTKQSALSIAMLAFGVLFAASTLNAKPIFHLTQSNKGIFGYDVVNWTTGTNEDGHQGWVGNCENPGLTRCKPPGAMPDPTNEENVIQLVDYALLKIANGSRAGSKQITVQVEGETFKRVYTVTWSATDMTARPDENTGDGQSIDILVDLTEV